ncbi:pirin family protein [Candidatus Pelagibacter communis]|uniref:pirin family protein n=1 Tax=Pelagibacter ubique TaxID=198252 RepID=UPI00094DB859|nr:pirin family protein [Candidatus Pelagibacter ubique]
MSNIEIKKIVKSIETSDGAGVKLKRSIGTPEADYIDPFLMLDEFGSENKDDYVAGFPPHPHRGIETVTYMLKGKFEHEDSTGAKGIMSSGDVQWMKTGRGIIHSEMPAMADGQLLGFQLWINMPAKLKKNKPEYIYIKNKELGTYSDDEKVVKVIAGKFKDIEGPEKNHNVEPIYFHIVLKNEKEFTCEVPEGHNSFIYLLKGQIKVGKINHEKTNDSNLILLKKGKNLQVKAEKDSEFLFIAGKPIGEPIARGGPFVMNTKAEIIEAINDYQNGTFAKY